MKKSLFKITMVGDLHCGGSGNYDAGDLKIPQADLIIGMGDWVDFGLDDEYAAAMKWAKGLRAPFILVRGNHDNGAWARHARQVGHPTMAAQLKAHSPVDRMRMTEWKPMIWQEVRNTAVYFPKQTDWHQVPAKIQPHIALLLDVTPAYFTLEAGGMLFICLDTCNWLLGKKQIRWLEAQVKAARKPIVLAAHHHFLPVGIEFDTCQVHERDFLRKLFLENERIVAFLHGHAHFDRWWKYGGKDIIAVRNRAVRTVTFENGRVVESILDGKPSDAEPFRPRYLCAQCPRPGQVTYMSDRRFNNPWGIADTPCLGWLPPEKESVELVWTMRLPDDISPAPHELVFQIRNAGSCELCVTAPGLPGPVLKKIKPARAGQVVKLPVGALRAGYIEARLTCSSGWGYAAMTAAIFAL